MQSSGRAENIDRLDGLTEKSYTEGHWRSHYVRLCALAHTKLANLTHLDQLLARQLESGLLSRR